MKSKSKSKQYNNTKLFWGLAENVYVTILMYLFGFASFSSVIEQIYLKKYNILFLALYSFAAIMVLFVLNVGFEFYTAYYIEKKYELTNEKISSWAVKYIKSILLSLVLGVPVFVVVYYFMTKTGVFWWLYTFIFLLILNIIIGMIAPILILPIFYKFSKLDNEELENKMRNLADKVNVKLEGLYKFNMSKETKKANAAFTGIGKTKRIILGDTLLDALDNNEILAVFSHELGHYSKKHILKSVFFSSIMLFVMFYFTGFVKFEYTPDGDLMFLNIFRVVFWIMLIQNIASIFQNYISRKYEIQADNYAKDIMGDPKYLISALQKIHKQNMGDEDPNKIIEFIFYSHPSVKKRIKNLES